MLSPGFQALAVSYRDPRLGHQSPKPGSAGQLLTCLKMRRRMLTAASCRAPRPLCGLIVFMVWTVWFSLSSKDRWFTSTWVKGSSRLWTLFAASLHSLSRLPSLRALPGSGVLLAANDAADPTDVLLRILSERDRSASGVWTPAAAA